MADMQRQVLLTAGPSCRLRQLPEAPTVHTANANGEEDWSWRWQRLESLAGLQGPIHCRQQIVNANDSLARGNQDVPRSLGNSGF